ncbi:unnamed protein product [Urochloa decumbens]|uniref:Uncharacterized protein n=1 Tax=Urochloa decumbens TaxID=240449 RepID=A0ABC9E2E3_9POAL
MAPSFGRSISFPLSPARSSKPRAAAYHVRSISLPCRSHPLLAHLHTHIAAARAWAAADPTTTSPSSGLAHIDALLATVAEVLLLPKAQAAVRSASSDRLLDAFLLLADAHRGFQEALLALRRDAADVRAALRRRDAATRLASAARSQRRNDKDLARLAATVSSVAVAGNNKCARLGLSSGGAEEAEMAAALMDAAAASATASAAVFSAAASVSAAASSSKKSASTFAAFTKKAATTMEAADLAPEKLDELEQCIDQCESGSEMVFRSIVRTRVSLLNIRTPAI